MLICWCHPHITSLVKQLTPHSDTAASPEKQTEQILAIYPIVPSQTSSGATSIPPRASSPKVAKKSTNHVVEELKEVEKPKEEDSLIDFGNDDAPTPAAKSPDEIERMLTATGKPAEGPLIDFTQDLKKDLPADGDLL